MDNAWQDLMLIDRFGAYAGGGIGAGGYMLGDRVVAVTPYDPPATHFTWQFGGGLLWEVSDRLTFDVKYR